MLRALPGLPEQTSLRPIPADLWPSACCPPKTGWPQRTTALKLCRELSRMPQRQLALPEAPQLFSTWVSLAQKLKDQGPPPVPNRSLPQLSGSAKLCCPGRCVFLKNLLIFLLRNPISACAYPCRPRDRCGPGELREGGGPALQTVSPQAAASQLAKRVR